MFRENFGDQRQTAFCAYCGGSTETKDHVPSKVLLDLPYPDNLPLVGAYDPCNQGFSGDELYVACLIECAIVGSTDPGRMSREKVRRYLHERPALAARLEAACGGEPDASVFRVEPARVRNVVLKLARGHAIYEMNEARIEDPRELGWKPLPSMTADERDRFEAEAAAEIVSEIGSRHSQLIASDAPGTALWMGVQPGRYRYMVSAASGCEVRVVLSEYLAARVAWDM